MSEKKSDLYLRQLLCYPNLTVWMIINLEPVWLYLSFPMPIRDDALSSPPVEVHLWTQV